MFQLLSIHSPFFVLCHKNFIKIIFSNAKYCIYVKKMGNYKKMIENECGSFYMLVPPVKVPLTLSVYVAFFAWVEIYVDFK